MFIQLSSMSPVPKLPFALTSSIRRFPLANLDFTSFSKVDFSIQVHLPRNLWYRTPSFQVDHKDPDLQDRLWLLNFRWILTVYHFSQLHRLDDKHQVLLQSFQWLFWEAYQWSFLDQLRFSQEEYLFSIDHYARTQWSAFYWAFMRHLPLMLESIQWGSSLWWLFILLDWVKVWKRT